MSSGNELGTKMGTAVLNFAVERWCAWHPVDENLSTYAGYAPGMSFETELEKPNVDAIPALQRRRLSKLARAAFSVLAHCADTDRQEPVVFSSKMGEVQRTHTIMESIADRTALSPTSFSLSVHNSIGGLWSQIHDIQAPVIALAPVDCSPIPALLEAMGMLNENHYKAVNIVLCEEEYPVFYHPYFEGPPGPVVLGLRLVSEGSAMGKETLNFDLHQIGIGGEPPSWKVQHTFRELLDGRRSTLDLTELAGGWRLQRKV